MAKQVCDNRIDQLLRPADDIVVASAVDKFFGSGPSQVHVLRGLNLNVRRGEFLAVMGPSGCGKSTLLHVLGLVTDCDNGKITFDGRAVGDSDAQRTEIRKRHIGFVFQRFNLLGVLDAAQNVSISLRVRGVKDDGYAARLFKELDVADAANRKPGQMSIGQQQRVAVIRALAHRPALLLADEPTGNLDSHNSGELLRIFQRINRHEGQTIIMITHSPESAAMADRVVHMKDGQILEQP